MMMAATATGVYLQAVRQDVSMGEVQDSRLRRTLRSALVIEGADKVCQ
jgi:hypothetical protein